MSTNLNGYTRLEPPSDILAKLGGKLKTAKDNRALFQITITDRDFKDINGQIEDLISYLKSNLAELKSLRDNLPDMEWHVDFGYEPKVTTGELVVESITVPIVLSRFCSDLGIELVFSLYDGNKFAH